MFRQRHRKSRAESERTGFESRQLACDLGQISIFFRGQGHSSSGTERDKGSTVCIKHIPYKDIQYEKLLKKQTRESRRSGDLVGGAVLEHEASSPGKVCPFILTSFVLQLGEGMHLTSVPILFRHLPEAENV